MPFCACLKGSSDAVKEEKKASEEDYKPVTTKPPQPADPKYQPKVYVTRAIHDDAIAILDSKYQVEVWHSENKVPREKLLNDVRGASAIICTIGDEIDEEVLHEAGPSLQIVCTMTSGVNHIDAEACNRKGVALHHVADICADVNAETTIALLLMVCKRLMEGHDAVLKGEWGIWKPMWLCGMELDGKTLGILGFGRVGYGVAKRLENFNLSRILYFSRHEHPQASAVGAQLVTDADEIFSQADLIICCLSLSKETHGFISAEKLKLCKPECVLVNTARAELVNQEDLVASLNSGELAGAGLDVTTPEPLPPTHPLLKHPRCVVLPHMGTATTNSRRMMAVYLANAVVNQLS